jgi:hypothetical protein
MAIYLTKTWGFDSPSGPLQFSQKGWRDRARDILKPGDLVVIVGTVGEETTPEERGKILGLMEPTTHIVSSIDYDMVRKPNDFDEGGNYRWPFGLELKNAWRFEEPRTLLTEISARRFGMDSAQGIVPLLPDEALRILALPRVLVPLIRPIQAAVRIEGSDVARRKAAPPPTTTRTGIMHMRRMSAFTYAMILEGTHQSAFKIGWAFDWKLRARQFNQAAMPDLGGIRYRIVFQQLWATASEAFRMEQTLLRTFEHLRHTQNTEVITPVSQAELQDAWVQYILSRRGKTVSDVLTSPSKLERQLRV